MPSSALAEPVTSWWGGGPPPTDRWPGVTIAVDDKGGRYRFEPALADKACAWFPRFCSHSKGVDFAGKAFELLDYQVQLILRPLFGWVRVVDNTRRFRKAYIEIPKKNGKTQLIAGLALYMLLADNEPGAEVYVAASDTEQARILFQAAKAMVEASPALAKRLIVFRNMIQRKDDPTAFFKVLSSEAASKHGPNIHCLIIDELHAQPDRELFETLTRGVIARRQPLILLITTAGDDDESICYEEYEYAKRVLSGTIEDDQHLPVIFEASKDEDWKAPAIWRRVNPALGVTVQESAMEAAAREADNEPRKLNDFLRYHLNRWVNQATAWIPVDAWDRCADPIPSDDELRTLPCAGGLDLAQKWDLAAFVVGFRQRLTQPIVADVVETTPTGQTAKKTIELNYRLIWLPFFWIPEDTIREHDHIPYPDWVSKGWVTATEGPSINYTRIFEDITTKILPRFPRLKQGFIGYDPAFATDLATSLKDRKGLKTVEILQNYQHLSEISHVLEALIKAKRIVHGGHRVLRSHIENVAIKTDDAGRIRPVKPKTLQKRKHIDGVVAGLMASKALAAMPDGARSLGGMVI